MKDEPPRVVFPQGVQMSVWFWRATDTNLGKNLAKSRQIFKARRKPGLGFDGVLSSKPCRRVWKIGRRQVRNPGSSPGGTPSRPGPAKPRARARGS